MYVPELTASIAEPRQRIVAAPGTKEFGRLSVMVQQLCSARTSFTIRGKSFVPPPDVHVATACIASV